MTAWGRHYASSGALHLQLLLLQPVGHRLDARQAGLNLVERARGGSSTSADFSEALCMQRKGGQLRMHERKPNPPHTSKQTWQNEAVRCGSTGTFRGV